MSLTGACWARRLGNSVANVRPPSSTRSYASVQGSMAVHIDVAAALSTVKGPTLFVDGHWCRASDGEQRPTINPFDQSVLARIDDASAHEADQAIAAAQNFFSTHPWCDHTQISFATRAKSLLRIAELLERHRSVLATLETLDTGKTLRESTMDIEDVANVCRFYAKEALQYDSPRPMYDDSLPPSVEAMVTHEPIGVCALIMPWNYPILQLFWKLAPALVAGNAVVIKPSEVTPLSTLFIVRHILLDPSVNVPAGAVQLLTAHGARVGPTLTQSQGVDLVSFTGGHPTGQRVLQACAGTIKKTLLELGGKNPQVVFADVDLDWAAEVVATSVFVHSGQVCSSATRLIVDETIAGMLVDKVVDKARHVRMGSGLDPSSETGPLVSKDHLDKIKAFVELGKLEGAKLLVGGTQPDPARFPHLAQGNFFLPTVFDACHNRMRIVQEETFGPILTVERFKHNDEAEAMRLANDTPFGLAAGVQSKDLTRAARVANKVRAGTTWINGYGAYCPSGPWGGRGLTGGSRELGPEGLREYLSVKSTYTETEPASMGWFTARLQ